jgi:predicted ATP-grasp superfamily ATP-dependent carboligase
VLCDERHVEILGICRSVIHRNERHPFVYGGSIGPLFLSPFAEAAIQRFCDLVALRRNLRGLFNVDVILDAQDRVWVLEVNPRWSASMEIVELGLAQQRRAEEQPRISLMAASLAAQGLRPALSHQESIERRSNQTFFKKIHFAKQRMEFCRSDWENDLHRTMTLHDIPADGEFIDTGHPICTTIERVTTTASPFTR